VDYDPVPMNVGSSAISGSGSGRSKMIPAEIKAKSGGGVPIRTLAAVLVLLVLNVISLLVLIFVNLRGLGIVQ
jgi:hypothetical protein